MNYRDFLKAIPKMDLHHHLVGSVRPETFVDLASKHDIPLPKHNDPKTIYAQMDFFDAYTMASDVIRDDEDFRRVSYESMQEAAASNIRYREMFWNPQIHMLNGVSYKVQVDAILEGIQAGEKEFGNQCRLIADIPRKMADGGVELVNMMIEYGREEVIGLGCDFEHSGPPEDLFPAYKLARENEYHLCGHCGQTELPDKIAYFIDVLKVDRIDHGYSVLLDYELTKRCAAKGIIFTVCPTIFQIVFKWDHGKSPVREMINRGIKVTIGSDDPGITGNNLADDLILMADHMGYMPKDFKHFILDGIDACWIDDKTKDEWIREWGDEIDRLIGQIDGAPGLQFSLDPDARAWEMHAMDTPYEERGVIIKSGLA